MQASQSSLATVFPTAFRTGNLSAIAAPIRNPLAPGETFPSNVIPSSLLSPHAQRALAYMPLPSLPGLSNNYQARTPVGNTTDQTLNRVDQNLGDKARLMFRMAYQDTSLLQGSSNPFNGFNVPLGPPQSNEPGVSFGVPHAHERRTRPGRTAS
jgi:hypothetical protein